MSGLPLALIVAVGRNGVIGADDALPWRMPSDLKHFRQTTMGKPVLMGRKTFASIGRPLPGRFLVVLSRDPGFAPDGVEVASTMETALDRAAAIARHKGAAEVIVAGGGTVYRELIGRAQRLYVTEVDLAPAGDTLFPPIDRALWSESERRPQLASGGDEASCAFVIYDRR